MATRKIKDAKDLLTNELIYFKGHAQATYMSDGRNVEDAINQIGTGGGGGITGETDPIFAVSAAASITEEKKAEWDNKVDKENGKGLSTEDFTTALKTKLEGLSNYDDTELSEALSTLRGDFDKLVSGDTTTAIKTFNEIIAFLDGISDSEDLSSIIASIEQQIADKQATISDLATIRSGAALGATAVQPSSLSQVATSGSYNDLSDKPTIPDVSNKVDKVSGKGLSTNDYTTTEKNKLAGIAAGAEVNVQSDWNVTDSSSDAYIKNKPTIPSAVTESTVSGWGFTKNTGTYSKPSGGIPKGDLASAVQTSLGKADTALQSYTEQYKGTVTGVKINGTTKSPSSGVVDLGTVITSHQDISGKQDKLVSGTNIKTINGTSILGSGNITIEGGGNNSGSSDKKEVIYFDYDVLENMRPNVVYIIIDSDNVQISSFAPAVVNDDNRYVYDVFTAVVSLGTGGIESVSLTLPDYIYWANGAIPEVTEDYWELSISRITEYGGEGNDNYESYFAVLTPFKPVE